MQTQTTPPSDTAMKLTTSPSALTAAEAMTVPSAMSAPTAMLAQQPQPQWRHHHIHIWQYHRQ